MSPFRIARISNTCRCSRQRLIYASIVLFIIQLFVVATLFWVPDSNKLGPGRIVLWTPFYGEFDYTSIGLDGSTFDFCPYKCKVIPFYQNSSQLHDEDAVIIHMRDVTHETALPPLQRRSQLWVFLLAECPKYTYADLHAFNHTFNLTMTYRLDSDIIHPYGLIRQRAQKDSTGHQTKLSLAKRPNIAAVIVSHCRTSSNRESFIADLQEFIQVDVYGSCGKLNCAGQIQLCKDLNCRAEKALRCYKQLSKSYKFYLAFENSLCIDYISEKFFFALMSNLVPIVYGGADYSKVAPPHSYINARDFATPGALAEYLKYLNTRPDEYLNYFGWKSDYTVDVTQRQGWCDLCTMVKLRTKREAYKNIEAWWNYAPRTIPVKSSMNDYVGVDRDLETACEKGPMYKHGGFNDLNKGLTTGTVRLNTNRVKSVATPFSIEGDIDADFGLHRDSFNNGIWMTPSGITHPAMTANWTKISPSVFTNT